VERLGMILYVVEEHPAHSFNKNIGVDTGNIAKI
jgi:hypothetical protein